MLFLEEAVPCNKLQTAALVAPLNPHASGPVSVFGRQAASHVHESCVLRIVCTVLPVASSRLAAPPCARPRWTPSRSGSLLQQCRVAPLWGTAGCALNAAPADSKRATAGHRPPPHSSGLRRTPGGRHLPHPGLAPVAASTLPHSLKRPAAGRRRPKGCVRPPRAAP